MRPNDWPKNVLLLSAVNLQTVQRSLLSTDCQISLPRWIADHARRERREVEKVSTIDRQVLNRAFVDDRRDRSARRFDHLTFGGHVDHRDGRIANRHLNIERRLPADGHNDVGESRRDKSLRAARFDFVSPRRQKDDAVDSLRHW